MLLGIVYIGVSFVNPCHDGYTASLLFPKTLHYCFRFRCRAVSENTALLLLIFQTMFDDAVVHLAVVDPATELLASIGCFLEQNVTRDGFGGWRWAEIFVGFQRGDIVVIATGECSVSLSNVPLVAETNVLGRYC